MEHVTRESCYTSAMIAALPMYDWPERHDEVDAEWAAIRDRLRAGGVDAPEALTRVHDDLLDFWKRPDLLFAQTCWGPMELGLAEHVQVVGQPSYDGIEGGQGELYSSAIVMRRGGDVEFPTNGPPSVLSDISPSRGEITPSSILPPTADIDERVPRLKRLISPREGEMSDRTEGGLSKRSASVPVALLRDTRLAYNVPDSMSGIIGLTRDLEALGETLAIFSEQIETGGHRKSIRAVAEGSADVAAIDCLSWHLAKLHEPAAKELQVVGWTSLRKGLPFITAKGTPPEVLAVLKQAVS